MCCKFSTVSQGHSGQQCCRAGRMFPLLTSTMAFCAEFLCCPCVCGFSPSSLASEHNPKTWLSLNILFYLAIFLCLSPSQCQPCDRLRTRFYLTLWLLLTERRYKKMNLYSVDYKQQPPTLFTDQPGKESQEYRELMKNQITGKTQILSQNQQAVLRNAKVNIHLFTLWGRCCTKLTCEERGFAVCTNQATFYS